MEKVSGINVNKKKVLQAAEYSQIIQVIDYYKGLPLDCELNLIWKYFPKIDHLALKSIIQTHLNNYSRSNYWRFELNSKKYLNMYKKNSCNIDDFTLLIKIAILEGLSPSFLSRTILQEKYNLMNKSQLSKLVKYPHLISDPKLESNITQCICSDSQDGPIVDLRRRLIGEEYEMKLKKSAMKIGLSFYDEKDLRRMGYDKTPDLKMILPFLYKGEIINWIESKAMFGDLTTHKWYLQQQLSSYINRFGTGIVIYWFGFHEKLKQLSENNGIIVMDHFPDIQFIKLFNIPENNKKNLKYLIDTQNSEQ